MSFWKGDDFLPQEKTKVAPKLFSGTKQLVSQSFSLTLFVEKGAITQVLS
ncbi:hypothetical protein NLC35_01620 [Candidatus Aminicenantes bacterium AC-334-K16]|nr:hypothetical protein [Candidatus Aminicenantes bacterium AC-334-K16]